MGAVTDVNQVIQRRLKVASYQIAAKANTTNGVFYQLVERLNASGKFKHKYSTGAAGGPRWLRIYEAYAKAYSATLADNYFCQVGVVVRVNATNADVVLFPIDGRLGLFPNFIDCAVDTTNNVLKNIFSAVVDASDTGLQTDVDIKDEAGNNIKPAVGDLVFRVVSTQSGPAGNIAFASVVLHYDIR